MDSGNGVNASGGLWWAMTPSGAKLTRMGHPHDPLGHSHHNSVWISHNDVDGVSFWADRGKNAGRIVTQRVEKLEDGADEAAVTLFNHWIGPDDKVLLVERRRIALHPLAKGEWLLLLDLTLEAKSAKTTLGKMPFGLVGVRLAKTIGIADGGGVIRNMMPDRDGNLVIACSFVNKIGLVEIKKSGM